MNKINFNQKLSSSDDRNYHITSDLHFFHQGILNFCPDTRPWKDVDEMNQSLIEHWNSKVGEDDVIFHLGDFSFKAKEATENIISQLNGNIVWVRGNHCYKVFSQMKLDYYDYLEVRFDGVKVCMMHYPISCWNQQGRGSVMLHGHCVDKDTEILTDRGFLLRSQLTIEDKAATLNPKTREIEYQKIDEIIDNNFTGEVFSFKNRSVDYRVTDEHVILFNKYRDKDKKTFSKTTCKGLYESAPKTYIIPCSGENNNKDYNISDGKLRLYVNMVTDGSLANKDLIRFHLKKERKIKNLVNLLESLGIKYSCNQQKSGTTKINFKRPDWCANISIKPLDNFVLQLSQRQVNIMINEYAITDGNYTSKNGIQVSTSKEEEADLLQSLLVTSGYRCNKVIRNRVDGGNPSYILSINTRKDSVANSLPEKEYVVGEDFWCIKVENKNFVCRRKGKVHITGNCHNSYQGRGKIVDVGWDKWGRIITLKEAVDYCLARETYCPDQHKIVEK